VAKYGLCSDKRRGSFHTRSICACCGLYGGTNNNVRWHLYLRSHGLSRMAWWYLALSSTATMRLPRRRWRSSWRRKDANASALKCISRYSTGQTMSTEMSSTPDYGNDFPAQVEPQACASGARLRGFAASGLTFSSHRKVAIKSGMKKQTDTARRVKCCCLQLKAGHTCQTNRAVLKLTAPKHATDLRVGACSSTGSWISGATHRRQRDPCCWKWHSSRLHSSMSSRPASRRSFFTAATRTGSHCATCGRGLRGRKNHLAKQPLALPHPELDAVALTQVLRQNGPIPQARFKSEVAWCLAQICLNARRRGVLIRRAGACGPAFAGGQCATFGPGQSQGRD
jgi:hypothetical protein